MSRLSYAYFPWYMFLSAIETILIDILMSIDRNNYYTYMLSSWLEFLAFSFGTNSTLPTSCTSVYMYLQYTYAEMYWHWLASVCSGISVVKYNQSMGSDTLS